MTVEGAVLAPGWKERLVPFSSENTGGVTGWCLHPVDVAISKLAAGREKDRMFVLSLLKNRMLDPNEARRAVAELDAGWKARVEPALARLIDVAAAGREGDD